MTNEEIKEKTKKQLVILEKHLQVLEASTRVVNALKTHAVRNQLHKRAIHTADALKGLDGLLVDLRRGRLQCMDVLGAKKIPITVERKLKLVINNTGGNDEK